MTRCMIQDFRLLNRILGAQDASTKKARASWGTRNYLFAAPGTEEWEQLERLEAADYVVNTGQRSQSGNEILWRATVKGCHWVGLTTRQTEIAMGVGR